MTDILKIIAKSDKDLIVGLAGPGTGKSTVFKTIISSDNYKDKKILILSFINKLIDDLVEDFKDFDNVEVFTLHSFAFKEFKKNFKTMSIVIDPDLDEVISNDYRYINDSEIDFEERIWAGQLNTDEERFYKSRTEFYQPKNNLYSFNSIIYAINRFFEQNDKKIPKDYDLILIDEFQDFNQLEFDLIKAINKKNKVIVVGDDDQSIYDWKSAKPDLIRSLYNHGDNDQFSLDYCYRCTEVIINAVNSLIKNARENKFLSERIDSKKFLYSTDQKEKNETSKKYPSIDLLPAVNGNLLTYHLTKKIKEDIKDDQDCRILILTPPHLKQMLYEGLLKTGFNVVEFELFIKEERNKHRHKTLIETFEILAKRKTDNLALRKILALYYTDKEVKDLIVKCKNSEKGIWACLEQKTKSNIERDIAIFKKAKMGKKELSSEELTRFSEIFNLKNLISKMLRGFDPVKKNAIEVEMTTTMSSKGLSADYVYYLGIDDCSIEKLRDLLTRRFANF